MAKFARPLTIDQVTPTGPLTQANPPLPVYAKVKWSIDAHHLIIDNAWALAWTPTQVLVYWSTQGMHEPTVIWIRADQVKRRDPSAPALRDHQRRVDSRGRPLTSGRSDNEAMAQIEDATGR